MKKNKLSIMNDKIYTSEEATKAIIDKCKLSNEALDPFSDTGAFYDNYHERMKIEIEAEKLAEEAVEKRQILWSQICN